MASNEDFGRVGIVLANTGTPSEPTPRAVRRYLRRFLSDKRIAPRNPLAWGMILNLFILPKRSKASAAKYQKIWTKEGSPLKVSQEKLARYLQARYLEFGYDVCVESYLNYGDRSMSQVFASLKDKGCSKIVVLPLYPQSAYSTTGCIKDCVEAARSALPASCKVEVVESYSDNDVYRRAIARSIEAAGFDVDSTDRVLFSYHSIPVQDIESGDAYELQVGSSSLMIASELGIDRRRWTIGYQCRFDKGRDWLKPFTKDILKRWAQSPAKGRIFFVCPNFAIDCLETLYDIDHEIKPYYLAQCREAGFEVDESDFVYVSCLNATKAHIRVLVDVLKPYIEG